MTTNAFLSHSASDIDLAIRVNECVRSLDVSLYLYEDDPQGGQLIAKKLMDAIRRSDMVVVLLTKGSQDRPTIHAEIGAAQAMGKPVIPIVQIGVSHFRFTFLQGLEVIPLDLADVERMLITLQRSIKRVIEKIRENAIWAAVVIVIVLLVVVCIIWRVMEMRARLAVAEREVERLTSLNQRLNPNTLLDGVS